MRKAAESLPERLPVLYGNLIQNYFLTRVPNPDTAADLCQELWLRAASGWHRFEGRSSISTWLYGICANVIKEHYRKSRNERERIFQSHDGDGTESLTETERQYSAIEIDLVLALLPERERTLFQLFYREKVSVKEIAKIFGKPEGTIKYWLHMLRKQAEKLLLLND
jgi:RNA polymerase sigma-70 factor (ECF subfamily)